MTCNVYMAAMCNNTMYDGQSTHYRLEPYEKQVCDTVTPHRLESYHYVKSDKLTRILHRSGRQVLLDSGAYSAATLGAEINVQRYVEYIKANMAIIRRDDVTGALLAAGLDAIGDADRTWVNQAIVEDALGEPPVPCYHHGDPEHLAVHCVENYQYMALGGLVGVSTKAIELWLDRIWDKYLTDSQGRPLIRVHGFGLTSPRIMARYPWASVDSSSWVQISSFGAIYIAGMGVVNLSVESPQRKVQDAHYTTMDPHSQARVRQAIEERGFDMQRLQTSYASRRVFNLAAFAELAATLDTTAFKRERQELF